MFKNSFLLILLLANLYIHTEVIHFYANTSFEEVVLASSKPVVIKFFTKSCTHCIAMARANIFEKASEDPALCDKVLFVEIDAQEHYTLSKAFDIHSVPTIIFLKEKAIVDQHTGFLSTNALKDKIIAIFALT
jgi:thioredoxin